jgi:nucleoside-triphosphatase THEP1
MQDNILLISGIPGIGKSTLLKKIIGTLETKDNSAYGFITDELLSNNVRVGFEMNSLSNNSNKILLAHKDKSLFQNPIKYTCANYYYQYNLSSNFLMEEFINFNKNKNTNKIFILDEIGIMQYEAFDSFGDFLDLLFDCAEKGFYKIICTIKYNTDNQKINQIKKKYEKYLKIIDEQNRNNIFVL